MHPDFRRAVVYGLLALAALIGGNALGGVHLANHANHSLRARLVAWLCVLLVLVFGVLSSRTAGNEVRRITQARTSTATAATLRLAVLVVGYLIALLAVLSLVNLPTKWYAGGTVVAIILGVAAQQVLGNFFAGLVLLFARPYVPGEEITVYSGALGGPHEGTVTTVGLLYTTLTGARGDIRFPNSTLLAAAVGPLVPQPDEPEAPVDPVPGILSDPP